MTSALQIDPTADEAHQITAAIWETASSAEIMLRMLWESAAFRHSDRITKYDRQLHLFAASCARRLTHLLPDQRSLHAIQTTELFATGFSSRAEMHRAHLHAKAAAMEIGNRHNQTLTTDTDAPFPQQSHSSQNREDDHLLFEGALLHAAATASSCAYAHQIFGGLQAADSSAKYSIQAIYWELLSNNADTVIITETLEEEDQRQAQALRIFLGNPFDPEKSPAIYLPSQSLITSDTHQIQSGRNLGH